MLNFSSLETYLKAIGKGWVYIGDLFTAGGLEPLGATEGEIRVESNEEYNDLVFPEYTGPAVHATKLTGENPVVTIPLIVGNAALWEKISPTGKFSGGRSNHIAPIETSMVIFPEDEVINGIGYDGMAWTPAAPQNAVFFWRGYFRRPGLTFRQPDGGKVIVEATFQVMHDAARPEDLKLWCGGDPVAAGVTDLRI